MSRTDSPCRSTNPEPQDPCYLASTIFFNVCEALSAADWIAMASVPIFLGNKRIKTQHFVGAATKWIRKSDTEVTAHHRMRVAHQKYKDDELKDVLAQGHAHGGAIMHYRKVDGEWKFTGVEPKVRWTEFEHDQIFG